MKSLTFVYLLIKISILLSILRIRGDSSNYIIPKAYAMGLSVIIPKAYAMPIS